MNDTILDELRSVVGPDNVLVGEDKRAYETEWRGQRHGVALAVVRPATTEEAQAVLRACATRRIGVVAQGGNTGLAAGAIPDESGSQIVLALHRMRAIRKIDRANMTVTVEAGCTLQALRETLATQGLLFPLSLGSEGSCTIGGNLATNAGGAQTLRYGNARELCLGLEFLTAEGALVSELGGLRKDNTGFDLRNLIIGSEGCLGIVMAATLRIFDAPTASLATWIAVDGIDTAVGLLRMCQAALGPSLTSFEAMNRTGLELAQAAFTDTRVPGLDIPEANYWVLMQADDQGAQAALQARMETLLERAFEQGLVADAVLADSVQRAKTFWRIRENIVLAQARVAQVVNFDISLPISAIAEFLSRARQAIDTRYGRLPIVNFGHLGDGNLHFSIHTAAVRATAADASASGIRDLIYRMVLDLGGSFSAEHGIGAAKTRELETYKTGPRIALMRALKHALDPHGILNPGKVVGAQPLHHSPTSTLILQEQT